MLWHLTPYCPTSLIWACIQIIIENCIDILNPLNQNQKLNAKSDGTYSCKLACCLISSCKKIKLNIVQTIKFRLKKNEKIKVKNFTINVAGDKKDHLATCFSCCY